MRRVLAAASLPVAAHDHDPRGNPLGDPPMTSQPLHDVFDLLDDARYEEALAILDGELKRWRSDVELRALRVLVLLDLQRRDEAADDAALATELEPDNPFAHFAVGEVALARGEVVEALAAARTAQRLTPEDPEYLLLEARARTRAGQWPQVLALAERVLATDPDNELASILRTLARETHSDGPLDTAEWEALAERFPLNPFARSGRAWTLLERGRAKQARGEFEQALALDPSLAWAKEGLVLALKARNPVYGALLRFFFWMGRLPQRTQWLLVIGGVVGYNFLRRTAEAQPELEPFIIPLLVFYGLFVLLSWLADPLLNLLLMTRSDARRLLQPDEKTGALLVGACLGLAIVFALASQLIDWRGAVLAALGVAFTSLAFAAAYQLLPGRGRRVLVVLGAGLCVAAIASSIAPTELAAALLVVVILGVAASLWTSRILGSRAASR